MAYIIGAIFADKTYRPRIYGPKPIGPGPDKLRYLGPDQDREIVKLSRISFFKKTAQTSFLGGFWGEEHGKINGFQKFRFFMGTGPLFKIGGFLLFLRSNWAQ